MSKHNFDHKKIKKIKERRSFSFYYVEVYRVSAFDTSSVFVSIAYITFIFISLSYLR